MSLHYPHYKEIEKTKHPHFPTLRSARMSLVSTVHTQEDTHIENNDMYVNYLPTQGNSLIIMQG